MSEEKKPLRVAMQVRTAEVVEKERDEIIKNAKVKKTSEVKGHGTNE